MPGNTLALGLSESNLAYIRMFTKSESSIKCKIADFLLWGSGLISQFVQYKKKKKTYIYEKSPLR